VAVKSARTWIVRTGYLVTAATVAWVLYQLARQDGLPRLLEIARTHGGLLVLLLAAYAIVSLLQALAWWQLMKRSAGQASPGLSVGIFALTQLGKYLPGNVMHFVFRYALTRSAGSSRPAVLTASGLEPWILLCAALGLLVILSGTDWPGRFGWPGWLAGLLPALALAALAGVLPWLRKRLPGGQLSLVSLIPALVLQAGFLVGSALLFAVLLGLIDDSGTAPLRAVLAASVLAWLAGFVTPGSPGGLGVREVVLSVALSGWVDAAAAVSAVAAFRVLTVSGDLLVFTGGSIWWKISGRRRLVNYRHYLKEADRPAEPR
jgi:hypothetical protein